LSANNPENWRHTLSPEQFHVCWERGTEQPYSGALLHNRKSGEYLCTCCKQVIFPSSAKFDAGCGWPSFDRALDGRVDYRNDGSHGMKRVEISCAGCGSHMGHVFPDGPTETGQRYCVNSLSLDFQADEP
jgi:peptide-methionine (R)-S-oxide reductase